MRSCLLPYSKAAWVSWIEQGPTMTNNLSSCLLMILSASFLARLTVAPIWAVGGYSSFRIEGGMRGLSSTTFMSSSWRALLESTQLLCSERQRSAGCTATVDMLFCCFQTEMKTIPGRRRRIDAKQEERKERKGETLAADRMGKTAAAEQERLCCKRERVGEQICWSVIELSSPLGLVEWKVLPTVGTDLRTFCFVWALCSAELQKFCN